MIDANLGKFLVQAGMAQAAGGEPSIGSRLAFLLIAFAIVLAFEAGLPLFAYRREDRARNIGRNLAITGIFLGVNLLLHPLSGPLIAGECASGFTLSIALAEKR